MATFRNVETVGQRRFLVGKEPLVSKGFCRFLAVLFFLSVVFFVFFPSLKNGFVNWDDDRYVLENPDISRLSFQSAANVFSSFYVGNYHPLTVLSYGVEYHFFGREPFAYHLTNLLLHLCASLAALVLFRSLLGNRMVSWYAAALFALHPLRVESVAWISERKDVLCTLFFILALTAYVRYVKSGFCYRYRFACFCFFIAALFSKAMAVSLPVVLLLVDYILRRELSWKLVKEKAPFWVLSCAFGLMALLAQHAAGAVRGTSIFDSLIAAPGAVMFYIWKFFFPLGLACLYPCVRFADAPWLSIFLRNAVLLTGLGGLIWSSRRHTRTFMFGGLFFLVTLLPVMQFVPLGAACVADRYTYIPSLGLSLIVSAGFDWLVRRSRSRFFKAGLFLVFAGVVSALSVLTWQRCAVWNNSVVLWADAVKKTRYNAVGLYNLGRAYEDRSAFALAVGSYQRAVRIKPDYEEAFTNLCHSLCELKRYEEALMCGRRAIEINPASFRAYYLIGNAYEGLGLTDAAVVAYRKAVECNPNDLDAMNDLAAALNDGSRPEEAAVVWNDIIRRNPDFAVARFNLAMFYYTRGNYALARRHCDELVRQGHSIDAQFLKELDASR